MRPGWRRVGPPPTHGVCGGAPRPRVGRSPLASALSPPAVLRSLRRALPRARARWWGGPAGFYGGRPPPRRWVARGFPGGVVRVAGVCVLLSCALASVVVLSTCVGHSAFGGYMPSGCSMCCPFGQSVPQQHGCQLVVCPLGIPHVGPQGVHVRDSRQSVHVVVWCPQGSKLHANIRRSSLPPRRGRSPLRRN